MNNLKYFINFFSSEIQNRYLHRDNKINKKEN